MTRFSPSKFLPLLIAFCLLPCLFMGRAEAQILPSDISGLQLWLKADTGLYKDTAKTTAATLDGDAVACWADQSGGGHDAVQVTAGQNPLLKLGVIGNNQPAVRFNATNSALVTNLSITSGAFTVVLIYNSYNTGTATPSRAVQGSNNWLMGAYTGTYQAYANGTPGGFASGTASVTTGQYVMQVVTQTSATLTNFVNGRQIGTAASPFYPGTLSLGTAGSSANPTNGDIAEVIVYNSVLSTADQTTLAHYAAQHEGYKYQIIFAGNSLTQGGTASSGGGTTTGTVYPALVKTAQNKSWQIYLNQGVGGRTTPGVTNGINTEIVPAISPFYGQQIVLVWELTNDISAGSSASAAYANMVTCCQSIRVLGCKVAVGTMLPRGSTNEVRRIQVNAMIRTNWRQFADALMDFGNDPLIGAPGANTNSTYYINDLTHLNDAGYAIVAGIANPAVNSMTTAATTGSGTKRKTQ